MESCYVNLLHPPKILSQRSEDALNVILKEIKNSLVEMKNNKSPSRDNIVAEDFTQSLMQRTTPRKCCNAIIVLIHKKSYRRTWKVPTNIPTHKRETSKIKPILTTKASWLQIRLWRKQPLACYKELDRDMCRV